MKDHRASYLSDSQHYEQLQQLIKKSYLCSSSPTNSPSQSIPEISLYVQIDQIVQWTKSEVSNKPLLITSQQFGGKKTLICEFIKHVQKLTNNHLNSKGMNKNNCYIISQFASVNSYYSEILYKITMQLRNWLKIDQKVQLNEQKLRQYFRYWLEVSDDKIQKDYLGYTKQQKMQIIIIIEGVDKVVDARNQIVRPSFWLPDVSLKNIKIILTAQNGSNAIDCLQTTVSQKIQYLIPENKIKAIKQKLFKLNKKLENFTSDTHFGDLKIALKIMESHPKFNIVQKNITFQSFFIKFINYTKSLLPKDCQQIIYKLLACLIWNKKGLTMNTLRRTYKLSTQMIQRFLNAYKDIIISSDDSLDQTYMIINRKMRLYINKIINQKFPQQEQIKKKTHTNISKALKRQNNTVNALQQMIFHLIHSCNYTELKQLLSRIQNFLVLYTPLTKHLLCVCWFQLQIQFQYDPVFQYNKAIQRFLNHYYPSPQDTFKIIFQLSLFFREYSQFQNTKTPQFRHPPIRGQIQQLKQISIYQELVSMNMYQKCKVKNRDSLQQNYENSTLINNTLLSNNNSTVSQAGKKQSAQRKKTEKDKERDVKQKQLNKNKQQKVKNHNRLKQAQHTQPNDSFSQSGNPSNNNIISKNQIKEVQKLNVRIKFHQDKFKSLYMEEMQQYINDFYVLNKKNTNKNQVLDQDSDDSQNQMDETKIDIQKIKKGLLLKKFPDFCEQEYYRCIQKRTFYYYKQWIWMQFPWICQSLNNHYSQLIQKCMKSPTDYMSIDLQTKLITQAVKIAKIAKQNKKQIYENRTMGVNKIQDKISKQIQNKSNLQSVRTGRTNTQHKSAYLKSKQKFDISKLDEQILKSEAVQAKNNRRRYQMKMVQNESAIFMTDISVDQSYLSDKQNTQLQTYRSRLPTILKCSNIAASKAEKNIDIIDTRQYGLLVTKCDEIKFENQQLVKKIQLIQLNRNSLKQNSKQIQRQQIKLKIQELKSRKIKLFKSYKTQQALKAKLQMIIKLCDINKSHGSQSADLSNFLNSLKTMFKIQEENLELINLSCKKMLQDNKAEYRKAKQEKSNIQNRLKKQKNKFQKSLFMSNGNIVEKVPSKPKTLNNYLSVKKRKKSVSKQQLKKKNKLDKQLQNIMAQSAILSDHLGIQSGQHKKNEQILENSQSKIDKLNEISWKLNELIDQNFEKEKKIAQLQDQLNVNKGHREHKKQLKQRNIQSLINNNLNNARQRIKCLTQCFHLIQDVKPLSMTVKSG